MIITDSDPWLTEEQVGNPGCGTGTTSVCFALNSIPDDSGGHLWQCLMIADPKTAQQQGIRLEWQKNIDPVDNRPWCPKSVLENSKKLWIAKSQILYQLVTALKKRARI